MPKLSKPASEDVPVNAADSVKKRRQVLLCILLTLILAALGVGLWTHLGDSDAFAPESVAKITPSTPPALEDVAVKEATVPEEAPVVAGEPVPLAMPPEEKTSAVSRGGLMPAAMKERAIDTAPAQIHSPETSRMLSDLLAQKQLKEAELAVRELDQKIAGLNAVPENAVALPRPEILPVEQIAAAAPMPAPLPRVRSIKGFGDKLRAVLSNGGAAKTVSAGDPFSQGTVIGISPAGVEFRTADGLTHTLAFEE